MMGIVRFFKRIAIVFVGMTSRLVVEGFYGGYWVFCGKMTHKMGGGNNKLKEILRKAWLERNSAFIGSKTQFASQPILPHGFHGIHISSGAKIGKNAVIFQNVTIGSNTLGDSRRMGAPTIGDNVYIGSGACIIGKVTIGDNCRIGANCVIVKDLPPNSTAVLPNIRIITRESAPDNTFRYWEETHS